MCVRACVEGFMCKVKCNLLQVSKQILFGVVCVCVSRDVFQVFF